MLVERFYVDLEANLFGEFVTAREGMMTVPDGPGLGCDPDDEVLARYRVS
jgi:L-alanine-DL-glutamate epimerase-like enolase superfamily enzyme